MSILSTSITTRQLKHAVYDGQSWSRSVISTASAGSQYRYVDLQIDSNDHLHVAHWVTGDILHYRIYDGSSWTLNYTTSNADSYGVSLAVNSLNHAHIAFSTPGYVCSGLNLAYYNSSISGFTKINPDSTSTSTYNGCYPSLVLIQMTPSTSPIGTTATVVTITLPMKVVPGTSINFQTQIVQVTTLI